jgi:hypothetical protein
MTFDDSATDDSNVIICVTGNEPMPVFAKEEYVASPILVTGFGARSRLIASTMTELILAEQIHQDLDKDWLGPDAGCEDGIFRINPDCKTDHGERTNYKLKDQPFYMRGRNGKMKGY